MGEGFAVLNSDFTIADFSREGLRMIGLSGERVIGRALWEVYPIRRWFDRPAGLPIFATKTVPAAGIEPATP
ncbi:MAG: PAS domain-containing protein [Erythrobacter sp.]|nr:PAS domain-containing protein [Erythrobacter sp.]